MRKLYEGIAQELVKADIIVESVAHNNFLSVPVTDEIIIRSGSARDRLQNENAFELDSIKLRGAGAVTTQNANLVEGLNEVQLFFIPEDPTDIVITPLGEVGSVGTGFPTSFDANTNILTILADRAGQFTISYVDTGDVVRLSEKITVPEGLFRLGYGQGPFGHLGYGE